MCVFYFMGTTCFFSFSTFSFVFLNYDNFTGQKLLKRVKTKDLWVNGEKFELYDNF